MDTPTDTTTPRRSRSGGRQARQDAAGQATPSLARPYIQRAIPPYDIVGEEGLAKIEAAADRILAETGIEFRDDPVALAHWRRAGAHVTGDLVRFPPGLLRELLKTAPREFTQHARNPANSVQIGGKNVVFAPAYGSPFVMDLDRGLLLLFQNQQRLKLPLHFLFVEFLPLLCFFLVFFFEAWD